MAELFRLGVSPEAKDKIVPEIDDKRFLRFDDEERSLLYCFAATLCARTGIPPKKSKYESFVMDKSIKDGTLSILLLSALMTQKSVDASVDKVGVKQRKDVVNEILNPMANSGFSAMKEMMKKPDDLIIAKFIREMDEMYAEAIDTKGGPSLPAVKQFEP